MNTVCRICNKHSGFIFSAKLLQKYNVNYFHCPNCGFLQTDEPYWLEEAYKNPINIEDTGLVNRNLILAKRTSVILFTLFNKRAVFLDYAAGYGLFVRLMRDYGFNFFWNDPYTENILARGFEYDPLDYKNIELVTAFECFEHFPNPLQEIEKLLSISSNILFSTETFDKYPPPVDEWDYYGISHGQHISFYSQKTFKFIAKKYDLNFYSNSKSYHLLTKKRTSNFVFNSLTKISLLGFSSFVKLIMGNRVLTDSKLMKEKRHRL